MAKNNGRLSSTDASSAESPEVEEHSGSFGVGLFLGVVVGSFGMFLFGTPQGQELLHSVKKELEENPDTRDLPQRAQKLIASVRETVQETVSDSLEIAQKTEEFPKFKRRLAE